MFKKNLTFVFSLISGILFVILCVLPSQAAITIPGADGSDGALEITRTTVIDLSEAVTGDWNTDNSKNAGKGIYDPQKWAVVFKYDSVAIDAGATLSFSNHPSRAPVVWLVNGNVTINGIVSLNGQNYKEPPTNSEPGPGGFRGGSGSYRTIQCGAGFGPGGGDRFDTRYGKGGSYGTGLSPYGNQSLIPLIGGSGGGGNNSGLVGGAGGGAILIACQSILSLNGVIQSNGGLGFKVSAPNYPYCGSGSGGAIRLISNTLDGSGKIIADGGNKGSQGGMGLIRLERVINDNNLEVLPGPSVVNLASNTTALLWPPDNAPKVKILSIGDKNTPEDPRAEFGTYGADVALPEVSSTQVVVETINVEEASIVEIRVTPRFNSNYSTVNATIESVVSEDPLVIKWIANLPVKVGYSAVQVKVLRP